MRIKLYDLLKVFKPKTRIRLRVNLLGSDLVYEDILDKFVKSRYYQIYYNEVVEFKCLSGNLVEGFSVEIIVNGVMPDDI